MAEKPTLDTKLYKAGESLALSMRDLLEYFTKFGSLRVTDMHLKAGSAPAYRVDGKLQRLKGPPLDEPTVRGLAGAILNDSRLEALERDRSVDGSYLGPTMQFRLNCFYESDGIALAVRALEAEPVEVDQIGFPNNVWREILDKQWGLVLVTGITGAGKSTTIASLITRIARTKPCRIITLEDPVEYRLKGGAAMVSQREVGRDVPSFARGLRDCLREDPDVIYVGEMRDRESATWTLTAAETGHLVFGTIHASSASSTVGRILDLFPADMHTALRSALVFNMRGIVAQKLLPSIKEGVQRVPTVEIMTFNPTVRKLILEAEDEKLSDAIGINAEEGMQSFTMSLKQLVDDDLIDRATAFEVAPNPEALKMALKGIEVSESGML